MFSNALQGLVVLISLDLLHASPTNHTAAIVLGTEDQARSLLVARASQDVFTTCQTPGTFALTYDDGPFIYENQISDYLNDRGIKGSFFVNGFNYNCIYDDNVVQQLRQTYSQGHLIGSHTWSHPDITTLSADELNQQLDLVETALKKILGIKPRFFRPPYGNINGENMDILTSRGYKIINWSFDSQDSAGATAEQTNSYYDDIATQYPQPQIALNHETHQKTADSTTPHAIAVLQQAGYQLVSVSECLQLGTEPSNFYQSVEPPQARDASWTCDGTPAPGSS